MDETTPDSLPKPATSDGISASESERLPDVASTADDENDDTTKSPPSNIQIRILAPTFSPPTPKTKAIKPPVNPPPEPIPNIRNLTSAELDAIIRKPRESDEDLDSPQWFYHMRSLEWWAAFNENVRRAREMPLPEDDDVDY
jgi:hypothetical protein